MALKKKYQDQPFQLRVTECMKAQVREIGDSEDKSDSGVVRELFAAAIDSLEAEPAAIVEKPTVTGAGPVSEFLMLIESADMRARIRSLAVRAGGKVTQSDVMRELLARGLQTR